MNTAEVEMRVKRIEKETEDLPKDVREFLMDTMAHANYQDACHVGLKSTVSQNPVHSAMALGMIRRELAYTAVCQFTRLRFLLDQNFVKNEVRERKMALFAMVIANCTYREAAATVEGHSPDCKDPSCLFHLVLAPTSN